MLNEQRRLHLNARGISTIEIVPLLLLFALLINYSFGFFGVIHSGILNSIAARNYTLETFRNRTNLTYLRDENSRPITTEIESKYTKYYMRFHGITSEGNNDTQQWVATRRPIRFTDLASPDVSTGTAEHNTLVRTIQSTKKVSDIFTGETADDAKNGLNPIWVQSLYGICLNADCKRKN